MSNKAKRILFVSGVPMGIGGIENSTMNIYREIDRSKLLIDFAVRKPQDGCYHDEIKKHWGRIFNIFEKTEHKGNKKWNFLMDTYSIISFYKILKHEGPFSAVHIVYPHLDGFLILAAKLAKVPVVIAHSRNTNFDDTPPNLFRKFIWKLRIFVCKKYATHIWGCSKAACQYSFGDSIIDDIRAEDVHNPVYIKRYMEVRNTRMEACDMLGISSEKINFVNIARYAPQKNQFFLIDFFSKMVVKRKDLHLFLTGPGPLEEELRKYIIELHMEEHITMLDSSVDIPLLLKASNYQLLPSIYEGFGNVLIEAQAAGVPSFVSDACQPEPDLGLIDYIPLNKGAVYWADYILERIEKPDSRKVDIFGLMKYDTINVAKRMQKVYLEGCKYEDTL